jgi:hypothetical protein
MTNEPAVLSNFDPIAIGDEIAALEMEAQSKLADAKGEFTSRSEKIAAILWEVKVHHPEHLKTICERAKIGRSRRKELLQIGRGSKTIEQTRKESAKRQIRSRANRKARAVTVTAPASPHAETDAGPGAKPKPAPSNSMEALAEFKLACDFWLPQLNECDQDEASTHVNGMFAKLRVSCSSPGESAPDFEPVLVELGPAAGDAMQNVVTTPAESTSLAESSGFAPTQARNKKPLADISRAKHEASIEMAAIDYRYYVKEIRQPMMIPNLNLTTEHVPTHAVSIDSHSREFHA